MSDRRRASTLLAAAAVVTLALIASVAAPAARNAPPQTARDLALAYFSPGLTRAEVVSIAGRSEHDYRVDEGRIVAVRPGAVDLLERDGTRQTIAISRQTQLPGRLLGPTLLVRGVRVVTVRDNGGVATQVRPSSQARAVGRALFGATLVRAEVLFYQGKTPHDYRIDEGRIVAVKPTSVTLLERDGTRQTIPVSSSTQVSLGGQPVDESAVVKGLAAITIREGEGPAEQILLANGPSVVRR
jgi:hypothetical protein